MDTFSMDFHGISMEFHGSSTAGNFVNLRDFGLSNVDLAGMIKQLLYVFREIVSVSGDNKNAISLKPIQ
jgi:hypothetical protein